VGLFEKTKTRNLLPMRERLTATGEKYFVGISKKYNYF
jgi:hypothetical protein